MLGNLCNFHTHPPRLFTIMQVGPTLSETATRVGFPGGLVESLGLKTKIFGLAHQII